MYVRNFMLIVRHVMNNDVYKFTQHVKSSRRSYSRMIMQIPIGVGGWGLEVLRHPQ